MDFLLLDAEEGHMHIWTRSTTHDDKSNSLSRCRACVADSVRIRWGGGSFQIQGRWIATLTMVFGTEFETEKAHALMMKPMHTRKANDRTETNKVPKEHRAINIALQRVSPNRGWRLVLVVLIFVSACQPCVQAQQALNFGPKVSQVLNLPPLEIKDDEDPLLRLKKERFNAALNEAKARFDLYKRGVRKLPDLIEVGERLFGAEVDLYDKPEDRVRVLQRQLDVYNEAEENLEKQVKEGLATQADLERLRYYKLLLEIDLLSAKKDLSQPHATPQ